MFLLSWITYFFISYVKKWHTRVIVNAVLLIKLRNGMLYFIFLIYSTKCAFPLFQHNSNLLSAFDELTGLSESVTCKWSVICQNKWSRVGVSHQSSDLWHIQVLCHVEWENMVTQQNQSKRVNATLDITNINVALIHPKRGVIYRDGPTWHYDPQY